MTALSGIRRDCLVARARILQEIRAFFIARDFLEVETPVRVRVPAMEEHIDALPAGTHWLRTSPELHMKRLLAEGFPRIFQMGPCFRKDEQGTYHHPEFTMLEWYESGVDYVRIREQTQDLLRHLQRRFREEGPGWFRPAFDLEDAWHVIEVREAFQEFAGWDPMTEFDANRFDLDWVDKVEASLPRDRAVILQNFPPACAALARCRDQDPPVAERWELYLRGMEIANAYSELCDPAEQRKRFESWGRSRRERGSPMYDLDEAFLDALSHMPDAGGIALGVDRLVMFFTGAEAIADVRAYPE